MSIAENENKTNIQKICDWVFGITDIVTFLLIVLPLYPNTVEGYVYSVNLLAYRETTVLNRNVYWCMFLALILIGIIEILLTELDISKCRKSLSITSMAVSTLAVFLLLLAREAYAAALVFIMLIIKSLTYLEYMKTDYKS